MSRLPFQIKICGVTTQIDAAVAVAAGASAIGLNFYSQSKRFLTTDEAKSVRSELAPSTMAVGVFVNASPNDISATYSNGQDSEFDTVTFTFYEGAPNQSYDVAPDKPVEPTHSSGLFGWIQLHGVETPELLADVKTTLHLPVIRAFPWGPDAGNLIDDYLARASKLDAVPDAVLIDAHKPGEYGGTGETADWEAIARWRDNRRIDIPLVLAGGLTPDNVARAIQIVRPDAVDTASGVEAPPVVKTPIESASLSPKPNVLLPLWIRSGWLVVNLRNRL